MWNVMLDELPTEYEGYSIDSDFQTGIQIYQALNDKELTQKERIAVSLHLLFPYPDQVPPLEVACEGLEWFLNDWIHDNQSEMKEQSIIATDYDVDQWRIYSAFRSQYGINLNTDKLHFWEFMALLTTLEECAYTRIVGIRTKKINPKDSKEVKQALREAKKIYSLGDRTSELSADEQLAVDEFIRRQKHK